MDGMGFSAAQLSTGEFLGAVVEQVEIKEIP